MYMRVCAAARRQPYGASEREREKERDTEQASERVRGDGRRVSGQAGGGGGGRKVHWPSFASSVAVSKEHEVMNLAPPPPSIPAMGDARAHIDSLFFVYYYYSGQKNRFIFVRLPLV